MEEEAKSVAPSAERAMPWLSLPLISHMPNLQDTQKDEKGGRETEF